LNILVCIKQTFDTEAKIALNEQGQIDPVGVNLIINPYDEYAIEEGLRLKEKFGGEVTVVTMGSTRGQEALRTALAMGADKAILISDPLLQNADEWVAAEVLAKTINGLRYDLILAGRMGIDTGSSQVAVRVAEILKIPSITSVVKLEITENRATLKREIDGGSEWLEVSLPVLITAQKGLNEPRYPSVAGIMKAKKKPLQIFKLAELGFENEGLRPRMQVKNYMLPAKREAGRKLTGDATGSVRELVRLLREEAKVL
jgi:electron transfer flavoprotein beta subunit